MAVKLYTQLVSQRGPNDCAIATLAMVLARPYEEVLVAAAKRWPKVLKEGLSSIQMVELADLFGQVLKPRQKGIDIDEHRGILGVWGTQHKRNHAVILMEGLIFDPDRTQTNRLWDAHMYVKAKRVELTDLLEEAE